MLPGQATAFHLLSCMPSNKSIFFLLFLLCLRLQQLQAQHQAHADSLQNKRLQRLLLAEGIAYTGMLVGLNELWYKGKDRSSFHFFNDNREWQQVDKLGHGYSAYQLSRLQYQAFRWAGMSAKKAAIWGSVAGFAWMMPIEILDGFSAAYGASAGDIIANSSGALLFGSQQLIWGRQIFSLKYSFHPTNWAAMRPNMLGSTLLQQALKDYNGQTYWLSADLGQLSSGRTPRWLNLALGYGASGMIYGSPEQNRQAGYQAYSQLFLAPDINLKHIKSNKKAIRLLLFVLDGIHLPLPALEFSQNKLYFHPVYF